MKLVKTNIHTKKNEKNEKITQCQQKFENFE